MDLKVLWADTATRQLEDVFDYYKITVNPIVARRLAKRIVRKTSSLSMYPELGQREPLLADRQKDYRYIVEGNYKIIYWVDVAIIHIAAVFDTRQNPNKIKRAE